MKGYRFDKTGDGEVVAEARSAHMDAFLELRFPKSDIPEQARVILKQVPLRVISDIRSDNIALIAADPDSPPLDLTLAVSRGSSPIHLEYLANMGVCATMTLSTVVRGALWGMFAFHHNSPRIIEPSLRGAAELFTQFFRLQLEQRLERKRNISREKALSYQSALLKGSNSAQNLSELVADIAKPYCDLVRADGFALTNGAQTVTYGLAPKDKIAEEIANNLLADAADDPVSTASISKDFPHISDVPAHCAGALAVSLGPDTPQKIIFFRREAIGSVTWVGVPEKTIEDTVDGPRLIPRGSFAAYSETMVGTCEP